MEHHAHSVCPACSSEESVDEVWTEDVQTSEISRAPTIAAYPCAVDLPSPRRPLPNQAVLEVVVTEQLRFSPRRRRFTVHITSGGPDAAA